MMTNVKRTSGSVKRIFTAVGYGIASFLLPVAALMLATWMNGLYPFGPDTFLFGDQRTQYVAFFSWLQDVFSGNADVAYTTTLGLGGSTAALIGYYLASPFNLLLAFFTQEQLPVFCYAIVLSKAGCIQLTMQFYLRKRFGLSRLWACAVALGFTLSLWTITQLRCPMWLDGLIFLPLCAWGVVGALRDGRWRLLALSFGATILTCWYMGYIIGLFLCLYTLFEQYTLGFEDTPTRTRPTWKRVVLVGSGLLLGAMISAIIFLPSAFAMLDSDTAESGTLKATGTSDPLVEHLPMLANVSLSLVAAVTALVTMGIILLVFWSLRKRSFRFRASVVLLIGLAICLLGCLAIPALQHGSAIDVLEAILYGKWVDSRTPQMFASFLTFILAILFFAPPVVPPKLRWAAALFLFLLALSSWLYPLQFIWGGFRLPSGFNSRMSFLFVFMLTWCAGFALRIILHGKKTPLRLTRMAKRTGVAIIALALTFVGVVTRCTLTWHYLYEEPDQAAIDAYTESAIAQIEELEAHDPGVYRVAKTYTLLDEPAYNEGMVLGASELSSYTSTGDQAALDLLSALGYGDGHFYTYATSGCLVSNSLFGVKYLSSPDMPTDYEDAGLSPIKAPEGARFYENPYALSLAYGVPETIADFQMPKGNRWECTNAFTKAVWGQDVDLYPDASTAEHPELDTEAFQQMIADMKQHQFIFEEFGGSHISGTIDAAENQMLLMTIPNQTGWSITVNGNEVTPQDVADGALMAIPVDAGMNQVEMRFTPPGLIPGAILSACALLFIIAFSAGKKRKMLRRQVINSRFYT